MKSQRRRPQYTHEVQPLSSLSILPFIHPSILLSLRKEGPNGSPLIPKTARAESHRHRLFSPAHSHTHISTHKNTVNIQMNKKCYCRLLFFTSSSITINTPTLQHSPPQHPPLSGHPRRTRRSRTRSPNSSTASCPYASCVCTSVSVSVRPWPRFCEGVEGGIKGEGIFSLRLLSLSLTHTLALPPPHHQ